MQVPSAVTKQAEIQEAVRTVERTLARDVVRIRYSIGEDWTGQWAIFFRVVLTNDAARRRLRDAAPDAKREKVFQEIRRPVFSLLDRGPLAESCTYISYDALRQIAELPHLAHTSDTVLDEYAEEAE